MLIAPVPAGGLAVIELHPCVDGASFRLTDPAAGSPAGNTRANLSLHDIEFGVDDAHVATITLNRPAALNAFTGGMAAELAWAWQTVRDTDDIHAVVLQANGDRAFCTAATRWQSRARSARSGNL